MKTIQFSLFFLFAFLQISFAQLRVVNSKLHIGGTNPLEKLHVEGGILLGNTTGTNTGTIRYTGSDIEGRIGSSWRSLTSQGFWSKNNDKIYYNDNNVGIGTTNPISKLQVQGGGLVVNGTTVTTLPLSISTASNVAGLRFQSSNKIYEFYISPGIANEGFGIYDRTNSSYRMAINGANGNVGFGTNSALYKVDISGVDYSSLRVKAPIQPLMKLAGAYNSGNGAEIEQNASGDFYINPNSALTHSFTISSSGKVGIGKTGAGAALDVKSPSLSSWNTRMTASDGSNLGGVYEGASGAADFYLYKADGSTIALRLNAVGSGYFNGGGNFGISTIAPSQRLDVNGNGRFRSIASSASSGALHYTSDGTLTTNTSDRRLKKKIKPLRNSLQKISKLRGVSYEWKEGIEGKQIGLIAQEVEKVFPQLVFTNSNDGFKGVHYDKAVAVLIEGMKEQQEQIKALQKQVKQLKKRK